MLNVDRMAQHDELFAVPVRTPIMTVVQSAGDWSNTGGRFRANCSVH